MFHHWHQRVELDIDLGHHEWLSQPGRYASKIQMGRCVHARPRKHWRSWRRASATPDRGSCPDGCTAQKLQETISVGSNRGQEPRKEARNSLFERELVVRFLDVRRVRVLLKPAAHRLLSGTRNQPNGGEEEGDGTLGGRSSRLRRSRWP